MCPPRYNPRVEPVLRAALARGPLVKDGWHYRFGRRLFNAETVNVLIAAGEAVRRPDGSVVRADAG